MLSEVFFDVETKKLFGDIEGFNPADLGVSIVSVYSRKIDESFSGEQNRTIEGHTVLSVVEGKMQSFWEKDFDESPSLRREIHQNTFPRSFAFCLRLRSGQCVLR